MRNRLLIALLAAVVFTAGTFLGPEVRRLTTKRPPGETPSHDRVRVTVGGSDVPGCYAEGAPFRAVIRSQWGAKWSENTLVFHWVKAADQAGAIRVSAEGQAMRKTLGPGQALPDVTVKLPLGDQTVNVALTTFVFDRLDSSGRACFRWARPPGTAVPIPVASPEQRT